MSVTKPAKYPRWADGGANTPTNVTEPTEGQKNTGYLPGNPLPAQVFNWLLNLIYQWIEWFDQETGVSAILELATWGKRSAASAALNGGNIRAAAHLNGLWFVLSGDSTHAIQLLTSPDGFGFTAQANPLGATDYPHGVAYGAGLYVVVADNAKIITSPDGVTWTSRTSGLAAGALQSVVFAGNQFVAAGNDGTYGVVLTSPDGITWTQHQLPDHVAGGITNANELAYGNGTYLAVATQNNGASPYLFLTSTDAVTWTKQTTYSNANPLGQAVYGAGLFVAQASTGVGVITSPDGITWTSRTVPIYGASDVGPIVMLAGSTFVGLSAQGAVVTSSDGVTWTPRSEVVPGTALSGSLAPASDGVSFIVATATALYGTVPLS